MPNNSAVFLPQQEPYILSILHHPAHTHSYWGSALSAPQVVKGEEANHGVTASCSSLQAEESI